MGRRTPNPLGREEPRSHIRVCQDINKPPLPQVTEMRLVCCSRKHVTLPTTDMDRDIPGKQDVEEMGVQESETPYSVGPDFCVPLFSLPLLFHSHPKHLSGS